VAKSLGHFDHGPVGLVHTQKIEAQSEKPTWTKALEFTQFACPCGTDPRLLSGEQRTSHFKLVTSVDDPIPEVGICATTRLAVSNSDRPPLPDIDIIRRIGCPAGRYYLGSRRRSRSRHA